MKIIYEKITGIHLTNGQFKGAMLLAGFINKDKEELNWNFNISENSKALHFN